MATHTTTNTDDTDAIPRTCVNSISAQFSQEFSDNTVGQYGHMGTKISLSKERVLNKHASIDEALQKLVPHSLQQRLFDLSQQPFLSGHREQHQMYDTMKRDSHWPNMSSKEHRTLSKYLKVTEIGTTFKQNAIYKVFPATRPLEFVVMDILGPLPKKSK